MTYKLESALSELADAIRTLKADMADEAVDTVCDSEELLAKVAERSLRTELCGVGFKSENPALTVVIWDRDSAIEYQSFDPIQDLIKGWGDPRKDESARAAFDRAYAALQSGIDRLRAYEAERIQAQP